MSTQPKCTDKTKIGQKRPSHEQGGQKSGACLCLHSHTYSHVHDTDTLSLSPYMHQYYRAYNHKDCTSTAKTEMSQSKYQPLTLDCSECIISAI